MLKQIANGFIATVSIQTVIIANPLLAQAQQQNRQSFSEKVDLTTNKPLEILPIKVDPVDITVKGLESSLIKDNDIKLEGHFYKQSSNQNPCSKLNFGVVAGFTGAPLAVVGFEVNLGTNTCKSEEAMSNTQLVSNQSGLGFLMFMQKLSSTCIENNQNQLELVYWEEILKSQNHSKLYSSLVKSYENLCKK
jgi:hypothetical protein